MFKQYKVSECVGSSVPPSIRAFRGTTYVELEINKFFDIMFVWICIILVTSDEGGMAEPLVGVSLFHNCGIME